VPKEERSFENTFLALADFEAFYGTVHALSFLSKVHPDEATRKASTKASAMLTKYNTHLGVNVELYTSLKDCENIVKSNGAYEKLDQESQRYLDKSI
jgi:Zn-dependent oligopeptidase